MRTGVARLILSASCRRGSVCHAATLYDAGGSTKPSSPNVHNSALSTPKALSSTLFHTYQQSWRSFASSPPARPVNPDLYTTLQLLDQANVLQLKEELTDLASHQLHIPVARLHELISAYGLADGILQSQAVAEALHTSGVVMVHNGLAYLRPEEIAELVMQLLPNGAEETQRKLAAVQTELKVLDVTHSKIELYAGRKTLILLSSGAAWLTFHIVAMVYLVWWELSWDVMEPIAYVISLVYTLVAYLYFLATRGVFDLKPMHDHFTTRLRKDQLLVEKFDERRYKFLLRLEKRYLQQLAHHGIEAESASSTQ